MIPKLPTLLLFFLCIFAASDVCAATLTVTKTADTNDAVCDADCSLREAVAAAASGDTVVFSTLFNTPQTITLTLGQINITQCLTITGTGQDLVTISGNNASSIFHITGPIAANITGATFRDGNGSVECVGGAIWVNESTLNVSNATFTNNSAACAGGAVLGTENSIITLSSLLVVGNSSQGGGAAISGYSIDIRDSVVRQNTGSGVGSNGTANIERCVISDNTVTGVGAQHLTIKDSTITNNSNGGVSGGTTSIVTIERCLITGNSRTTAGGVLSFGMTTIKDSQITNNIATAGWGGGISNEGTLYLVNSVVSGNTSSFSPLNIDGGGGVRHRREKLYVINSTVSGNTGSGSPGNGGGIYDFIGTGTVLGRVYLVNSTVANNTSVGAGGGVRIDTNGEGTFFEYSCFRQQLFGDYR